jgi:uncharacterized lipoprotein
MTHRAAITLAAVAILCILAGCDLDPPPPRPDSLDYFDPLTARDIQLRNRRRAQELGSVPYVED